MKDFHTTSERFWMFRDFNKNKHFEDCLGRHRGIETLNTHFKTFVSYTFVYIPNGSKLDKKGVKCHLSDQQL